VSKLTYIYQLLVGSVGQKTSETYDPANHRLNVGDTTVPQLVLTTSTATPNNLSLHIYDQLQLSPSSSKIWFPSLYRPGTILKMGVLDNKAVVSTVAGLFVAWLLSRVVIVLKNRQRLMKMVSPLFA
jgi:hypothetical protein